MDLDDRLYDIASFAKADGSAGIEKGRVVGRKTEDWRAETAGVDGRVEEESADFFQTCTG